MILCPKPSELRFKLSRRAASLGFRVVDASVLTVDRCWRGSVPQEYISRVQACNAEEIDQAARDYLLENYANLEPPEVMMLGNSHLAFRSGMHLFVLLRDMADLGMLETIPFAVSPCDADKFRFYLDQRAAAAPLVERPVTNLRGL